MPNISLGTVYRSLDALASEGVIMVIERAGERARYDYRHEDHHHVVCRGCGAIFDVPATPAPPSPSALPAGFRVTEVVLEYHGLCGQCQQET